MEPHLGQLELSFTNRYSIWVRETLNELPDSFTITDPSISGHPIVFASNGFLKMSGYEMGEVVGKNGRVFQGPKTDRRSVLEIREAIRQEKSLQVSIVNYRRDGRPFWMLFCMRPVFGKEDGRVVHFVGVQVPIMRKRRQSGGRNGGGFCEDGLGFRETMIGSCRREVCLDSVVELSRVLALDSDGRELEVEEHCEASDLEKTKAASAMNNILSVLTHYSELTRRLVCGKRCCLAGMGPLGSSLILSLGRIKQSFVLSDPHLPDMPIVYVSDAFLKLTGYAIHEVLGRNCRFLGGVDTDSSTIFKIKESIQTEQACTVRILNYRKDKSSFWNVLHISPVRNASGKIAYYVGVQIDEGCKNHDKNGLSPEMRQHSAVGAVKVAVRSLSMVAGTSES
ncbi:protein TWIN LOV 1 isoform X1 [Rhododendron vialii]|uniref:protein TWIN LOV 1 isoform X1 n=1 Tax=Rhododendron vialii TaxID=182163 RepID=UPI00265DCB46|nr:protein TWIN LOV 1 isoform X1 [Rhododendron vialii]